MQNAKQAIKSFKLDSYIKLKKLKSNLKYIEEQSIKGGNRACLSLTNICGPLGINDLLSMKSSKIPMMSW